MRRLWVGFMAAALLLPATAAAQSGPDELARTHLLEQAEAAYGRGDHAAALDFAQRAGAIRTTPSVLLMLAQEHNALGHTLDALAAAERCLRDLEADRHVPHRHRMLGLAQELRNSLRTRVGYVTVRVPTPAPAGLQVRVQGGELVPALWNVPYPALPGNVTVEASATGATFRRDVTLAAGATEAVTVALTAMPVVEPRPQPIEQPVHTTVTSTVTPHEPRPSDERPAAQGPGVGPWIVAGAGVAALGAGLAFFLLRNGAVDDRDAACPTELCAAGRITQANDAQGRAETYNLLTNVTVAVGAAAVAGGVLWYVLARPRGSAPSHAALRWNVAPTPGGAMLGVGGSL